MKWIVLVYLLFVGIDGNTNHTRLEFPTNNFQECIDIEQQINDIINRGRESETEYVRYLYWEYNNILEDIKAECVFTDSLAPFPEWFNKKKQE